MTEQSILIVDDDPSSVRVLAHMLADEGRLRFALSAAEALHLAQQELPDLMLLDAEMPGMNGFDFCAHCKAEPRLADVPIIFVTKHGGIETEVAGFAVGAADFIRKPPDPAVVVARVRTHLRMKHLSDALRRAALVDGLTGVSNRRRFDDEAAKECARAQRNGGPVSLLMIDVDWFKAYNDRYGHLAGDACLHGVARAIQQVACRPADELARYGGEEFVILLPQTDQSGALHIAQRVLDAVASLQLRHEGSTPGGHVTVSVGATTASHISGEATPPLTVAALVAAADSALYEAKNAGRARIHFQALSFGRDGETASEAAAAAPSGDG
jgi:diguanylate cyclase (GGDEF)-like protein